MNCQQKAKNLYQEKKIDHKEKTYSLWEEMKKRSKSKRKRKPKETRKLESDNKRKIERENRNKIGKENNKKRE